MVVVALLVALLAGVVARANPSAVALQPSSQWYGADGNWSAITLTVGDPGQTVNVLVSTGLSEFWVVESGGCFDREPLCGTARGNVFTIDRSKTWKPLGTWGLGLDYLGYGGNGDYGLDSLASTTLEDGTFSMGQVLTAAINSTDYYNGFFGLGIVQGRFGDSVHDSPLTQAVKQYGRIPSYSYGYTAGAYYAGSFGMPCSLTLGGYDENRFVPHNIEFTLAQNGTSPRLLVRGISVSTVKDGRSPLGWVSTTRELSNMSNSFEAVVDSSTPYLWLPEAVCDQFAQALGLTYNSIFELYTINNTQFDTLLAAAFSFTFSLSSFDNTDDFGDALTAPGVVNITITAAAFAQILRYPFQDAIGYGDPSIPYFPLRRAANSSTTFIIGRSFLQEAYLITKYDSGVFSIHQTQDPENPLTDLSIKNIDQPDNSPFPPPAGYNTNRGSSGLTTGQIAGIAVGIGLFVIITALAAWLYCRRRKRSGTSADQEKDQSSSSMDSDGPRTPIAKILSRIAGRRRSRRAQVCEVPGSSVQPTEVGADAGHAVYELPAPIGPMELDASHHDHSDNDDTELGTDHSQNLSAYEAARRKLAKQLQGPVPPYSPPENPASQPPLEKDVQDNRPPTSHQPSDAQLSPISSSTTTYGNSNSFPGSLPSPLSPRGDSSMRISDYPSPVARHGVSPTATQESGGGTHPPQSQVSPQTSNSRSESSNAPASPQPGAAAWLPTAPAGLQRTPIDPSKVVYLGPLPDNLSTAHSVVPSGTGEIRGSARDGLRQEAADTLGSNYTELETQYLQASRQNPRPSHQLERNEGSRDDTQVQTKTNDSGSQPSQRQERIDNDSEFIHVPQLAERRYSWENER